MAKSRVGAGPVSGVILLIGIVAAAIGGWDVVRSLWTGEAVTGAQAVVRALIDETAALTALTRFFTSLGMVIGGGVLIAISFVIRIVTGLSESPAETRRLAEAGSRA